MESIANDVIKNGSSIAFVLGNEQMSRDVGALPRSPGHVD